RERTQRTQKEGIVSAFSLRCLRSLAAVIGAAVIPGFTPISAQDAGIASVWPIRMRRASNLGLADIKASSLMPYLRAIPAGVSPALTVWVFIPVGIALLRVDREPPEASPVELLRGVWAEAN